MRCIFRNLLRLESLTNLPVLWIKGTRGDCVENTCHNGSRDAHIWEKNWG